MVDQHVAFGAGGMIELLGDTADYNNGVGQVGVRADPLLAGGEVGAAQAVVCRACGAKIEGAVPAPRCAAGTGQGPGDRAVRRGPARGVRGRRED